MDVLDLSVMDLFIGAILFLSKNVISIKMKGFCSSSKLEEVKCE